MYRLAFFVLVLIFSVPAITANHPVPTARADLKGSDWFPYVMSKIAPLEWWAFEASPGDVKRENYQNDFSFRMAVRDTWDFPRFCFSMFRPKPEGYAALLNIVRGYKGGVIWLFHDDCISAFASLPTFYAPAPEGTKVEDVIKQIEEAAKNPPKGDPEFVKKAMADLPNFCSYLEDQLGLKEKQPQQFDQQWLTKEGLSKHPPDGENFLEAGSWSVALGRNPKQLANERTPSPNAEYLSFGVSAQGTGSVLEELGVNWEKYQTTNDLGPVSSEYPQLSKLIDDNSDVIYSPDEAEALLNECVRADKVVKNPASIRTLDKLIRIARWAHTSGYGIYFGGQ